MAHIATYRGMLKLRPQFVGAYDAWIVEGHYKSNPYGNPYLLCVDGRFVQIHTNKVATR